MAPAVGQEGSPISLTISANLSDIDGSETLTVTVDNLPDGATLSAGTISGTTWILTPDDLTDLSVTMPTYGEFFLEVKAMATETSNGDTTSITTSLPVSVTNVAPTIDSFDLSATTIKVGEDLTATVSFSDPGSGGSLSVTFDWGDGITDTYTTTDGTVTVDGVHQYLVSGFYFVIVTIDDGDSTTDATSEILTVYSPGDAFITGGGTINVYAEVKDGNTVVTPGMCQYDFRGSKCKTSSGTANSGFDAQYPDPNSAPEGSTQFTFSEGGFDFFADSYDWLIIVDGWAQYGGVGTVNDNSRLYSFVLTAIDAEVDTFFGVTEDRIGIKITDITDPNNPKVVFDTALSPEASQELFGTVPTVGGATVKIHKSGYSSLFDKTDGRSGKFLACPVFMQKTSIQFLAE